MGGPEVDRRRERAATNESLFREVNERIEDLSGNASFTQFVCECYDDGCDEHVSMTVEEYEHVRAEGNQFLVLPDHQWAEVDEVVEATERYLVIRKRGAGERMAEQLNPRSRETG